jgi:hypothetical protein
LNASGFGAEMHPEQKKVLMMRGVGPGDALRQLCLIRFNAVGKPAKVIEGLSDEGAYGAEAQSLCETVGFHENRFRELARFGLDRLGRHGV